MSWCTAVGRRPARPARRVALLSGLILALGAPATAARSETHVGGVISASTTWTLAGSPYVLDSSVDVRGAANPVLTIEAGVVVKAGSGRRISIGDGTAGELRAVGTEEQPIVFTTSGPSTAGYWQGLHFHAQSGGSRLEHAVVEGGGGSYTAGIRVTASAPALRDVTVRTTYHRGIWVASGGAPEITRCAVNGATGGEGTGIHVAKGGRLNVTETVVTGAASGAIRVEPGAELNGLTGMVLTGNGQNGVRHEGGVLSASETWRSFGYPYFLVDGSVDVRGAANPVLTIEPGVVVKMGSTHDVVVGEGTSGELRAIGTEEQPIVFTTSGPLTAGYWQGLHFHAQSGGSRLEHAVVEGGGGSYTAGIRVTASAPVLRDVTVRTTYHRGIWVASGGAPEITRCAVNGATGGEGTGIHVAKGGRLNVTETVVTGAASGAIRVEPGAELNGLTGMVLTGNGQNGVRHEGGVLSASETWRSFGYPYFLVDGSVDVRGAANPVLTIEPGVVVKMGSTRDVVVGEGAAGELRAIGAEQQPIVFTTSGPLTAGYWQGLHFHAQSGGSRLEHAVVEGGGGSYTAGIRVTGSAPALRDVTVRTTYHRGIWVASGGSPDLTRCAVSGTTGGEGTGIRLFPGSSASIVGTATAGNSGAGLLNEGSTLRLRNLSTSGNGAEGLRSAFGALALRDGSFGGQAVPIRNLDALTRVVDARHQWWGSAAGPTGLVGRVEHDPWLGGPPNPSFVVTSLEVSTRAFPAGLSHVRFDLELSAPAQWTLRIVRSDGSEVRRIGGIGKSASPFWDGTDDAGATLADGAFTFRLEATQEATGLAAAPLVGRVSLDATLPVALLATPGGTATVAAGEELTVEGSAAGPGFQSYVLESGEGEFPAVWTVVDRGIVPVHPGRLGSFTTALLPPGRHTLRLTVTGAAGKTAVATARVDLVDPGACR